MRVNKETKQAISGIYNGTLAYQIKKNSRYAVTGVAIGAIAGILMAKFFGKSKLLGAVGGGLVGGGIGYMLTPAKEKEVKANTDTKQKSDSKQNTNTKSNERPKNTSNSPG